MPTLAQVFPRLVRVRASAPSAASVSVAVVVDAPKCPGGAPRGGRYLVVARTDNTMNTPAIWRLSDVVHIDSPSIVREGAPYVGPLCPHELALLEDCHGLKPDWSFTVTELAA